jgi:hypothetical protein
MKLNKTAKISLQSPKTEFGLQNQYDRMTYPSIGNFTWSKKKYTFGGQKDNKRPLEPKNEISGPKSKWSCDISIVREFYMEREKHTFGGQKGNEEPSEPRNEI